MVALFGCAWAVIATAVCVGAVVTRRSVLAWMKARKARLSGDDTVEIVRPGMRKVAVYAALVVLALPAGVMAGGSALPGPSAQGSVGVPTVGGIMTGQLVFSGVSTDISTGINEDLTIAPAGAGGIGIQTTTGDVDIDTTTGNVTVDCTTASGEGCIKINHADTNGNGIWMENATGNNAVRLKAASASAGSWYDVISSANVRSLLVGAFNASFAGTDFANRAAIYSADKVIVVSRDDDVAAGSLLMTVEDNSTLGGSTAVRQFSVDGNGAIKMRVMTSTNGATCNSANEGLLYYRVIDASNKSGFCMCARTASGVYGWKMGMTFGSSALTDGDC